MGMSEFSFSLIFMGGSRDLYGDIKYPLPANVVHLEKHYLMEAREPERPRPFRGPEPLFADNEQLHDYLRSGQGEAPHTALENIARTLGTPLGLQHKDLLYSELAWEKVRNDYERFCTAPSFIDYFWSIRTMHAPLFMLAKIAEQAPPARLFHAVSTGYAGFLGMLLRHRRQRPYILTEHGIYTKERKIDLAQADWLVDAHETFGSTLDEDVSYIRRLWIHFFEGIGRLSYDAAEHIIALYEGNRQRQISDGAQASRTQVIPNGIDLERLAPLREQRSPGVAPPVLCLIGRIVPIKDVKTFIRAMRSVCTSHPQAEGWIVGPEDEDEEYAKQCHALVDSLELGDRVRFLGFQNIADILPKIGLLVLTSISEALPLVILEGYAAGVPALATDVGSCRELIEGSSEEDRALGHSGAVVPIANPEETARAALMLLTDGERWRAAQQAGFERVERYYTQKTMFARYRKLYQTTLESC